MVERTGPCETRKEKRLAATLVRIYNEAICATSSGATPNVIALELVKQLSFKRKETKEVVTVASGSKFGVLGK